MDPERITRKIYNFDLCMAQSKSWSSNLYSILDSINMTEQLISEKPVNLKIAKELLMCQYSRTWYENCQSKSKLETYVQIKKEISTEAFLKVNLIKAKRSVLSNLRYGTLPLHIETGRYEHLP